MSISAVFFLFLKVTCRKVSDVELILQKNFEKFPRLIKDTLHCFLSHIKQGKFSDQGTYYPSSEEDSFHIHLTVIHIVIECFYPLSNLDCQLSMYDNFIKNRLIPNGSSTKLCVYLPRIANELLEVPTYMKFFSYPYSLGPWVYVN